MIGYIKVHRSLFEHELWTREQFTKGQAWIDLIGMANFSAKEILVKNTFVTVGRGEILTAERELASRWQWSTTKVRSYLKLLESAKMIAVKKAPQGTVISIENYSKFQDMDTAEKSAEKSTGKAEKKRGESTEKAEKKQEKSTEKVPSYYIKKEKKDKKDNNSARAREAYGEFDNVFLSVAEFEKLQERFPNDYKERIERLSEYMASRGKRYKDHYATILAWARRDEKTDKPASFMDL